MKIFVNARFLTQPISGVQRYAIECSRQIKKMHPETVFLSPKGIIHEGIAQELEAQTIGFNKGHLWEQIDLPLFLNKKNVPLLNLANTAPLFYKNNYITIHDLAFYHHPEWNSKLFSAWYNFLVPRIARRSKHIFTVSQIMRSEIIEDLHIAPSAASVTYNGLSELIQETQPMASEKEKIILSVGSFNLRKNHDKLINAFLESELKQAYTLIILGDEHHIFKHTGIDEHCIKDNHIKIIHRLSETELVNMYHKAEIVVSLSAYEGFGIPVLEGLYCGCKAICSDIPVYRELYDKYAYFCDAENKDSINSALVMAVNSKNNINNADIQALAHRYNYAHSASVILNRVLET